MTASGEVLKIEFMKRLNNLKFLLLFVCGVCSQCTYNHLYFIQIKPEFPTLEELRMDTFYFDNQAALETGNFIIR